MALMGSARAFGGAPVDVAAILQAEGISPDAIEALLLSSSSSSSAGFHGSRSMMCFEDFNHGGGSDVLRPFSRLSEAAADDAGEEEADEYGLQPPEKKRRLSVEQVQFLEKSFEAENKLEPERKLQLARELGLQPRQVAIWFQNRRARWKTKQLEKDYEALQSSFKALKCDYDGLLQEKEKLQAEIAILKEKLLGQEESTKNGSHPAELPSLVSSSPPPMPPPLRSKMEDMCSASSAVVDHNSSQYAEEAWHSSADMPEAADPSELSQPEESEGERRLEGAGYDFKHDTPWFWPY